MKIENLEKDSKGNEDPATWVRIGLIGVLVVLLIVVYIASSLKFSSSLTIINEMAMNTSHTEMSYNEITSELVVTGSDKEKAKFRFPEENWEYLQKRLMEENKDWGGWTFEHKEVPAGENHIEYLIHYGTRKPKQ